MQNRAQGMPENQSSAPENQSAGAENQTPVRSRRGGPRPGSGRPRGSRDRLPRVEQRRKASFRELYDTEVEKNAPKIIKAAIEAATRGDSRALVDCLNRVIGPPAQKMELSGPGGTPIALQAAAPIALAMMSTDELRALVSFHKRIGLPDVEGRAVESGPSPPLSLPSPLDIDDSAAGGPPAPQAPGTDPDESAAPNSTIQADNPAPIAPESPQERHSADLDPTPDPGPIDAQDARQTPADAKEQDG